MKDRVRTIAAVIALVASVPTVSIAVGNLSGYLSDDWAIYTLILMSFGLPASTYLVGSYWRERKARDTIVIEQASSGLIVPSGDKGGSSKLRLVSAHRVTTHSPMQSAASVSPRRMASTPS